MTLSKAFGPGVSLNKSFWKVDFSEIINGFDVKISYMFSVEM
jgi:hypothetical protein